MTRPDTLSRFVAAVQLACGLQHPTEIYRAILSGSRENLGNSVDRMPETLFTKDMEANTTHRPAGAERKALMASTIVRPSDADLGIKEGWSDGKSAAKILSAIGHPGYGEKFARTALAAMATTGRSAHEVIYGLQCR